MENVFRGISFKNVKKIRAFVDLTRVDHGIMLCIAILIGALIAGGIPDVKKYFFAFLTALFLEMGAFALNDYFDYEVDKKNRRMDRPLVRGDLKPSSAMAIYLIFSPIGMLSSLMVNKTCFYIALINLVIATIYDVKLKEIKVIGNFYIAFVMAIPFVFGAVAVREDVPSIVYFFAFLAFLSGGGREIIKDVMDFEGDKLRGTKSFPHYFGIKKSNEIASVFILLAIALSFIPFFFKIDSRYYGNILFLSFLIISNSIFIYSISLILKNDGRARKYTLAAMFIALIAFLAGSITFTK